jgi:hypothetical protein
MSSKISRIGICSKSYQDRFMSSDSSGNPACPARPGRQGGSSSDSSSKSGSRGAVPPRGELYLPPRYAVLDPKLDLFGTFAGPVSDDLNIPIPRIARSADPKLVDGWSSSSDQEFSPFRPPSPDLTRSVPGIPGGPFLPPFSLSLSTDHTWRSNFSVDEDRPADPQTLP